MDELTSQFPILIKSMLWVGVVFTYGVLRKYKKFKFNVLGLVLAAIFTIFLAVIPSVMSLLASLALLNTAPADTTIWLTDTFGLFTPHINAFWASVAYLFGLLAGKCLNPWFSFRWSQISEPLTVMISLHLLVEFAPKIFQVSDTLGGILVFLTFPFWVGFVVITGCLACGYKPKLRPRRYPRRYSEYGYDDDWDYEEWYYEDIH